MRALTSRKHPDIFSADHQGHEKNQMFLELKLQTNLPLKPKQSQKESRTGQDFKRSPCAQGRRRQNPPISCRRTQ